METMDALNRMLLEKCESYLSHQIRGKPASVGEMLVQEQGELFPLPGYPFDPCKRTSGRVDRFCTVRFDTNNYSVPAAYCGKEVSVKAGPEMVWIYCEGKCVAQHPRCLDRRQAIYKLEHYLPLLEKKGRAIFYARPVQDTLPRNFLDWLQKQRLSPKELVELLRRCQEEDCDAIMTQSSCHAPSAQIQDTVVVQEVDLHLYDAFLQGKVGCCGLNPADELIRLYAKQLKIPTFAEYQEILRQADPSATFPDLLLELMKAETLSRQENQNKRRLKAAGFPYLKTLEEFDCTQLNDAVSPLFLQELASCQFIQNRQNIVMIGNPGRGKTHLSIALGLKACTRGYRVLFKNAATLSTELCEAKDNYHLGKLERTLAKADLLILDELSYLSFNRHQSELLFKVISDRSEKSSTIVTTNLPFSQWTDLFENTTMVAALIDRLTYRSHVLDMNGDSYRLKATLQSMS